MLLFTIEYKSYFVRVAERITNGLEYSQIISFSQNCHITNNTTVIGTKDVKKILPSEHLSHEISVFGTKDVKKISSEHLSY